jgi:hypothetical protein
MGVNHSAITHRSKVRPGGTVDHMVADGPSSLDEQRVPVMLLVLILSSLLMLLTLLLPTFTLIDKDLILYGC